MTEPHHLTRLFAALLALGLAAAPGSQAWAQAAAPALEVERIPAQPDRPAKQRGDHIVVVVNTELVTSVEVAQRLEAAKAEAKRSGTAPPDDASLRQQVLDALIDERVLVTYAREAGVKIDEAEIDRAVNNIAAQNQLNLGQLRERLRAEGMDYNRFRSTLRDQMQVERVREREVSSRIRISDQEIDQLIDEQRARLGKEVQLNIAQILLALPDGADAAAVAQLKARAEALLVRLRAGDDFAALAREFSADANRESGGAIGLKDAQRLPDLFVAAVKDLPAAALAPEPVRSGAGWHLLKLLEKQQGDPFKITQTQARHILLRATDQAQGNAVARRLEDIRRQIERGEKKFDDVAREISEDGSAPAGGDLGWASPGQFVPEFEQAMTDLPVGGISPPVVSRFGVHLIQVVQRRETTVDPKEVRNQARNQLREQKYAQAYRDWVKELRLRAYIEQREPPR